MESPGTIIWWRADSGRGVVRLDGGKQYMFTKMEGVDNVEPLLRVRVLNVEKGPAGAVVTGFEDGRREFGAPNPPLIKRVPKVAGSTSTRNPDAPRNGTKVVHKNYGPGVVIGATAKMVRVRFDEDHKERSVRLTSISEPVAEAPPEDDDDAGEAIDETVTSTDEPEETDEEEAAAKKA